MSNNSMLHKTVIETISLNFNTSDFCVKSLAEIVGISFSYLREIIYTEYNICPQKIIEFYRIKEAANLLSSSEYPIYHISNMVGYSNSKTFSSAFKRILAVLLPNIEILLLVTTIMIPFFLIKNAKYLIVFLKSSVDFYIRFCVLTNRNLLIKYKYEHILKHNAGNNYEYKPNFIYFIFCSNII